MKPYIRRCNLWNEIQAILKNSFSENAVYNKMKKSLKRATQKEKNMVSYTSKNKSTNFTCTSIVCKINF